MAVRLRAFAAVALAAAVALPAAAQEPEPDPAPARILVVHVDRVIESSEPARNLARTEREIRKRVEARLDEVKSELEAEEMELTKLRDTLPAEEFQARTRAFDKKVREERRAAQERGGLLLKFLSDTRNALRAALPRVLEELRRERGASLVIEAGAVLAAGPEADVTEEAVRRFDEAMKGVTFDPPRALIAP